MKNWKVVGACLLLVGVVVLGTSLAVVAEDDDDEMEHGKAGKYATYVQEAKLSLSDAVAKAEGKTGGKAVLAGLEMDDGVLMYEVYVVLGGEKPRFVEVEVDAKSGKILDEGDKDDDDDHGDDDDDDGDEDDD